MTALRNPRQRRRRSVARAVRAGVRATGGRVLTAAPALARARRSMVPMVLVVPAGRVWRRVRSLGVLEGRGQARVLAGSWRARVWLLTPLGRVLGSRLGLRLGLVLGPRLGSRRALALATLSGRGLDRRAVASLSGAWPAQASLTAGAQACRSGMGASSIGRPKSAPTGAHLSLYRPWAGERFTAAARLWGAR
jgi:hypothetical protein